MDDSHACLKKDYVQEFHDHLNSVNPNIQFTKEVEQDNRLSFLDTTTTRVRSQLVSSVFFFKKTDEGRSCLVETSLNFY